MPGPCLGTFLWRLRGVAEPATPHGVPPARWHLIIQDMISVTPAAVISRATDMTYCSMISTAMTHGLIWLYLMKARSACAAAIFGGPWEFQLQRA